MTGRPIALLGASSGKIPGKNGARRMWEVMVIVRKGESRFKTAMEFRSW
jgi:hypothetical protein